MLHKWYTGSKRSWSDIFNYYNMVWNQLSLQVAENCVACFISPIHRQVLSQLPLIFRNNKSHSFNSKFRQFGCNSIKSRLITTVKRSVISTQTSLRVTSVPNVFRPYAYMVYCMSPGLYKLRFYLQNTFIPRQLKPQIHKGTYFHQIFSHCFIRHENDTSLRKKNLRKLNER